LYTVLVSLISLSGGQLPDVKMERYLRRLNIEDNTPLTSMNSSKTENLLKRLERDGYVFKVRENTGTGEEDVYWVVGPRGKMEVGDDGVTGLTKTVYGDQSEADEAELDRRIERSLGLAEKLAQKEKEAQQRNGVNGVEKPKKRGRPRKDADEVDEEEDVEGAAESDKE
jgi:melanoma-associated antigen